jgi:hypothetical protein
MMAQIQNLNHLESQASKELPEKRLEGGVSNVWHLETRPHTRATIICIRIVEGSTVLSN